MLFSILVLVASALVLPELNWSGDRLLRPLTLERQDSLFYVALAGWMPTAIAASVFQSIWVCGKIERPGTALDAGRSPFRFQRRLFLHNVPGALFRAAGNGFAVQEQRPGGRRLEWIAAQLIDIFTQVIGGWAYPVIGLTTMFVMISTVLTLLGCLPACRGNDYQQAAAPAREERPRQFRPGNTCCCPSSKSAALSCSC